MEEPFVPFTKPYGMSDEQFEEEVRIAQNLHDIWMYENQTDEKSQTEEAMWYEILKQEREQHLMNSIYNEDGFTKF